MAGDKETVTQLGLHWASRHETGDWARAGLLLAHRLEQEPKAAIVLPLAFHECLLDLFLAPTLEDWDKWRDKYPPEFRAEVLGMYIQGVSNAMVSFAVYELERNDGKLDG